MPDATTTTAVLADPPAPQRDGAVVPVAPTRSGRLRSLVRKLIDYGKALVSTLQHSPPATQVFEVTLGFGTRDIALILARIMRGLHLARALEDRLIRSAARLDKPPTTPSAVLPRMPPPAPPPSPSTTPSAAQPAASPAAQPAAPPAVRPTNDPASLLAHMPSAEEIAALVRRRPIGAVIAEICSDLGIVTSHPLWRDLAEAVSTNGGNWIRMMKDLFKRVSITNFFPRDTPIIPLMPLGWRPPSPHPVTAAGGVPP